MRSLKNIKNSASEIKTKCIMIEKETEIQGNNLHSSIGKTLANWCLRNRTLVQIRRTEKPIKWGWSKIKQ